MKTLHLGGPRHRYMIDIPADAQWIEHIVDGGVLAGTYRRQPFFLRGKRLDAMIWHPADGMPLGYPVGELQAAIDDAALLLTYIRD